MTIIWDDFKNGIDAIFHPAKNSKAMSIGETLGMYYKFSVIPWILFVVLGIILSSVIGGLLSSIPGLGLIIGGLGIAFVIVGAIVELWIVIPIGIIIGAALYYLVGGVALKWFKKGYSSTVTGVTYAAMVGAGFLWLLFIPIIGWIILAILGLWSLWVLWKSLSVQTGSTVAQAFIVWLIWVIIAIIIEFAFFGALLATTHV